MIFLLFLELAGGNKTCGSRGLMLPLILTGSGGGGDEESGGMNSGGGGASGGHSDQSTSEDSSLTDSDRCVSFVPLYNFCMLCYCIF